MDGTRCRRRDETIIIGKVRIQAGKLEDGDFLRIFHIVRDTSTLAVTLRGWRIRRTRDMNDLIDKKLNEVCWILHIAA